MPGTLVFVSMPRPFAVASACEAPYRLRPGSRVWHAPLGRGGERPVHVAGAQKQEASIAADACTVAPEHARVERHGGAGGRRQERTKGGATPLPDVPGPGSGAEQTALSALVTPCSVAARALCSHTSKHLGNAASRDLFPQRNFVGRCDVNVCRVRLALRLRLSPRVCRHVPPQGMGAGVRRCRPR